jgi:putative FmdB family regulatory protein
MAIYEYECAVCSNRFEVRGNYEEARTAVCPKCKGKAWRLFSPAAIKFAGDGYYTAGKDSTSDSCDSTFRGFG